MREFIGDPVNENTYIWWTLSAKYQDTKIEYSNHWSSYIQINNQLKKNSGKQQYSQ